MATKQPQFKGDGFDLRTLGSRSWADPKWGRIFAAELAERLCAACEGKKCLFLTLTYDRREYQTPEQLWHAQRDERHVRRFVDELGWLMADRLGICGNPLTGKWLAKLEFQEGGWVHWHIIFKDIDFIPHDLIDHAWGRGHAWIVRARRRELRYVAKYVAKVGALPSFVLAGRTRSLKVVRCSPGFWDEGTPRVYVYEPGEPKPQHPVYRSIAQAIAERNQESMVRTSEGTWVRSQMSYNDLVWLAVWCGARVVTGPQGWTRFVGRSWTGVMTEANEGGRPLRGRPPLHSIQIQKPPPTSDDKCDVRDIPYLRRLVDAQDREAMVA